MGNCGRGNRAPTFGTGSRRATITPIRQAAGQLKTGHERERTKYRKRAAYQHHFFDTNIRLLGSIVITSSYLQCLQYIGKFFIVVSGRSFKTFLPHDGHLYHLYVRCNISPHLLLYSTFRKFSIFYWYFIANYALYYLPIVPP